MIIIRDLLVEDLEKGFFETLESLTDVRLDITKINDLMKANEIFAQRMANSILTYVAIENDRVIGTLSLVPDIKFIHGGSLVMHIEDVAVHKLHQGNHVGLSLLQHAIQQATRLGAYKIVLNCYRELADYYARVGFHKHDLCLRLDLP